MIKDSININGTLYKFCGFEFELNGKTHTIPMGSPYGNRTGHIIFDAFRTIEQAHDCCQSLIDMGILPSVRNLNDVVVRVLDTPKVIEKIELCYEVWTPQNANL